MKAQCNNQDIEHGWLFLSCEIIEWLGLERIIQFQPLLWTGTPHTRPDCCSEKMLAVNLMPLQPAWGKGGLEILQCFSTDCSDALSEGISGSEALGSTGRIRLLAHSPRSPCSAELGFREELHLWCQSSLSWRSCVEEAMLRVAGRVHSPGGKLPWHLRAERDVKIAAEWWDLSWEFLAPQ